MFNPTALSNMTDISSSLTQRGVRIWWAAALFCVCLGAANAQALRPTEALRPVAAGASGDTRSGDFVVALVNSEPITNFDVRQRLLRVEQQITLAKQPLPPRAELVPEILSQLVTERALLQLAREQGFRVDQSTLLQAEQSIAAQNQMDLEGFRRQVAAEGLDIQQFRNDLRNQILLQRLREREVEARVRVSEGEIDNHIQARQSSQTEDLEFNLGHVLIQVPEGAAPERVRELELRAQGVADRLREGADLSELARQYSEAPEAATGGLLGLRPLARLPDLFVNATRQLPVGGVAGPLRSAAGIHVLKVVERRYATLPEFIVTQSRARHILLRFDSKAGQDEVLARLGQFRQDITTGRSRFEDLAGEHSQDASSRDGGDLGWASAGQFVPEFERAMNALRPSEISQPLVSRFGAHLIRLDERRQVALSEREQRESVRQLLREEKATEALKAWSEEVRDRAFVEQREAPRV